MKPSIGRIVHYVSHGTPIREDGTQAFPKTCRAAIITQVHSIKAEDGDYTEAIGLCVMNPTGLFFHEAVWQDEENQTPGSWHWPERVE